MGTNYYAHIMPSSKDRNELIKKIIVSEDFDEIVRLSNKLYERFSFEGAENQEVTGVIHLGKRSSGWKFAWNPNIYEVRHSHMEGSHYVIDPSTPFYVYPLTKKGIKEFIDRKDVVIKDEYGKAWDKEEFWKMALEWDGITHDDRDNNIYSTDYSRFLKSLGYPVNYWHTGFELDGLRFTAYTDFC